MTRRILAPLFALLLAAAPVAAADAKDTGKKLLPKLFESAAAAAADATVRVQSAKKDLILGTVVSKDGFILTKGSELFGKDGKPRPALTVVLRDGSVFDVEVKGYHPASDLMLLKADAEVLTAVKFADPKQAEPGNWVASPGWKDNSKSGEPDNIEAVAVGVVSSGSRQLYLPESRIENANRGYLGILFEPVNDSANTKVDKVQNEFAKKAGMKPGDAIIGLNDKAVKNKEEIFDVMNTTRPGEVLTVRVRRKGKDGDEELTFKVQTVPPAMMDRGALQNSMGSSLSDRRGGFGKVIQHDTVLAPSQCGGPLVDLEGNVLGINIARAGRVESWALPGDAIAAVFADLKAGKHPLPKKEQVNADDNKEKPKKETPVIDKKK
jgi:serine protease Do